jgi:hypothetical protein
MVGLTLQNTGWNLTVNQKYHRLYVLNHYDAHLPHIPPFPHCICIVLSRMEGDDSWEREHS